MNASFRILISIFIFCLFFCSAAVSQSMLDISRLDLDSPRIDLWYDSQIGLENTQLQLGQQEVAARKATKGHPFYKRDSWAKGTINFRGETFSEVAMLFDIDEDNVLIRENGKDEFSSNIIRLRNDQVSWFDMDSSHFIYSEDVEPTPGFFEELFTGDSISLISKRIKIVELGYDKTTVYVNDDRYYVKLRDKFVGVKSKRTVLKLLPKEKKKIRKFVRHSGLTVFKPNSYPQNISLIRYCNSLLEQ